MQVRDLGNDCVWQTVFSSEIFCASFQVAKFLEGQLPFDLVPVSCYSDPILCINNKVEASWLSCIFI